MSLEPVITILLWVQALVWSSLEGLMPGPMKQLSIERWVTNQSTAVKKDLQVTISQQVTASCFAHLFPHGSMLHLHMPPLRRTGYIASFWHHDTLVTLLANLSK